MSRIEFLEKCPFERLSRIVKLLSLEQKEAALNVGFDTFIREEGPYIDTRIVSYLIEHIDPSISRLDLFGMSIQLSSRLFSNVMIVKNGGEHVVIESERDISKLEELLGAGRYTISVTALEKDLKESTKPDALFLIKFALVAIGFILCPKTSTDVCTNYLHSLIETSGISKKNWASVGF